MQNLTVALLQCDLHWENPTKNFTAITECLASNTASFDLLVLPEMFSTGFTMNSEDFAEPWNQSKSVAFLQSLSLKYNVAIYASVPISEEGKYYNRGVFVENGKVKAYYDKRKLFAFAGEELAYSAGSKKCIVNCKGWKINLQICFDLRFPEISRNAFDFENGYEQDLTVYVANWPSSRIQHWNALLKGRAIENQEFVIGVNRIGTDGKGYGYLGSTQAIHPGGEVLMKANDHQMELCVLALDYKDLYAYRLKFPFLKS